MKKRALFVGLVIVGAGIALTGRALSEDKGGHPEFSPEEMKKMMDEWMALGISEFRITPFMTGIGDLR